MQLRSLLEKISNNLILRMSCQGVGVDRGKKEPGKANIDAPSPNMQHLYRFCFQPLYIPLCVSLTASFVHHVTTCISCISHFWCVCSTVPFKFIPLMSSMVFIT